MPAAALVSTHQVDRHLEGRQQTRQSRHRYRAQVEGEVVAWDGGWDILEGCTPTVGKEKALGQPQLVVDLLEQIALGPAASLSLSLALQLLWR